MLKLGMQFFLSRTWSKHPFDPRLSQNRKQIALIPQVIFPSLRLTLACPGIVLNKFSNVLDGDISTDWS